MKTYVWVAFMVSVSVHEANNKCVKTLPYRRLYQISGIQSTPKKKRKFVSETTKKFLRKPQPMSSSSAQWTNKPGIPYIDCLPYVSTRIMMMIWCNVIQESEGITTDVLYHVYGRVNSSAYDFEHRGSKCTKVLFDKNRAAKKRSDRQV